MNAIKHVLRYQVSIFNGKGGGVKSSVKKNFTDVVFCPVICVMIVRYLYTPRPGCISLRQ